MRQLIYLTATFRAWVVAISPVIAILTIAIIIILIIFIIGTNVIALEPIKLNPVGTIKN